MTSIAAILTIVGYSLNETVVVFDRTRELMRRYKTMPAEELLEPLDQLDDVAHGDDGDDRLPVAPRARPVRRPRHRELRAGDAVRRRDLHLLGDLHLDADADLSRRARERSRVAPARARCPEWRRPRNRPTRRVRRRRRPEASCPAAIRSTPTATAASASPRCPIAARSWRCPRASMPGPSPCRASIDAVSLAPVFAEGAALDLLLLGTGADVALVPESLRRRFREAGIGLDVMQTGAAARTYNVLLAENRKVGAALIAVAVSARLRLRRRRIARRSCGRPIPTAISRRSSRLPTSGRPCSRSMPSTSRSRASATRCARALPGRSACNGGATPCRARPAATCAANPVAAALDATIVRYRLPRRALRRARRCARLRSLRRPDAEPQRPRGLLRRDFLEPLPPRRSGPRRRRRSRHAPTPPAMPASPMRSPAFCAPFPGTRGAARSSCRRTSCSTTASPATTSSRGRGGPGLDGTLADLRAVARRHLSLARDPAPDPAAGGAPGLPRPRPRRAVSVAHGAPRLRPLRDPGRAPPLAPPRRAGERGVGCRTWAWLRLSPLAGRGGKRHPAVRESAMAHR